MKPDAACGSRQGSELHWTLRVDRCSSCHSRGCAQESSNRPRAAADTGELLPPLAPLQVRADRCLPCGRPTSGAAQPCPRRPSRRYRDAPAHADSVTGSSPLSPHVRSRVVGTFPVDRATAWKDRPWWSSDRRSFLRPGVRAAASARSSPASSAKLPATGHGSSPMA
jgi:hypothetical protein